jgi:hypothetical protein
MLHMLYENLKGIFVGIMRGGGGGMNQYDHIRITFNHKCNH